MLLVEFGEQSPAFGQMMGSNERSISISIDNQLLLISYYQSITTRCAQLEKYLREQNQIIFELWSICV
jgi:hypothetical protein